MRARCPFGRASKTLPLPAELLPVSLLYVSLCGLISSPATKWNGTCILGTSENLGCSLNVSQAFNAGHQLTSKYLELNFTSVVLPLYVATTMKRSFAALTPVGRNDRKLVWKSLNYYTSVDNSLKWLVNLSSVRAAYPSLPWAVEKSSACATNLFFISFNDINSVYLIPLILYLLSWIHALISAWFSSLTQILPLFILCSTTRCVWLVVAFDWGGCFSELRIAWQKRDGEYNKVASVVISSLTDKNWLYLFSFPLFKWFSILKGIKIFLDEKNNYMKSVLILLRVVDGKVI